MRLEFRDARAEHDTGVALFYPLLQRTHQIAVGAGHEPIAQFDHRDAGAERIVHAGHLQADDASAYHQEPLALLRQLQRTGGIDDARIVRESGQAHRLGSGRNDALLEVHAMHPVGRAQLQGVRTEECGFAAQHLDLLVAERTSQDAPAEQVEPGGVSWTTRKSSPARWSTSRPNPTPSR